MMFNYLETVNSNLICCICRAPFIDPTTTQPCAHTFCYECILRALSQSSPICPIDRSPLSLTDLHPANPIVRSLVDELQVECAHRQEGCLYSCQRQMMSLHLRDDCEYGEAHCPICEELLRRREVADHVEKIHGEEKNSAEAMNGGEEELEQNKEEVHVCPHAALGCPYTGPQKPSDHLSSCPYESLKGFFTSNTAKMSLLIEQNMLLRHRVDTLEATVQTLRKDMNTAKSVLTPWFRTSYQGGLGPRPVVNYGIGITSGELPVGIQHHTAGPSQQMSVREDPLAPYFPPAESVVQRPEIGHRQGSSSMVGDTAYSRTGMSVIAPLDLGTTLEGTLVGLRESMMGLAVGIDSVGRRSEIGLTNETLRLGEEMMSVRAQMHGLRMQMHGMMMDRNAALRLEEGQYFQLPMPPPPNRSMMSQSITKL